MTNTQPFVESIRSAAPYIHAFRGRTFVVAFGGEALEDEQSFLSLVHDLNLLHGLGVRVVMVHGARPQIEKALAERELSSQYVRGLRVTDLAAMRCAQEVTGRVRAEIETLIAMGCWQHGFDSSHWERIRIRVSSGNYITAKPLGVMDGVDMQFTGEVRRIDAEAIKQHLDLGSMALVSSLGSSPTGESFNLSVENVATQVAIALRAHKLIFMFEKGGIFLDQELLSEIPLNDARQMYRHMLERLSPVEESALYLPAAIRACDQGVERVHLIGYQDGILLQEIFTHHGVGTLITRSPLDKIRPALVDDVGGIISIIEPLEEAGILVHRPREVLEREIEHFWVAVHDGVIIGCAALHPYPEHHAGEIACLAVDKDFQREGYGEALLKVIIQKGQMRGLSELFALTTRTSHWFVEHGFKEASVEALPWPRQQAYNTERRSKIYQKKLV
ncbi:MAG: amino-acid N-acetyltransferase [Pseudomonadota bacterium]